MRGGWRRFGLYITVVAVLVAVVLIATAGSGGGFALALAQVFFIGALAYLLTFIVWPRRTRLSSQHRVIADAPGAKAIGPEKGRNPGQPAPGAPTRRVNKVGPTPPEKRPRSTMDPHAPEVPVERTARGRRPNERQVTGEMRWPAR